MIFSKSMIFLQVRDILFVLFFHIVDNQENNHHQPCYRIKMKI